MKNLRIKIKLVDSYEIKDKLFKNLFALNTILKRFSFNQTALNSINIQSFLKYTEDSFEDRVILNKRIGWIYSFSKVMIYKVSKSYLTYITKFDNRIIYENEEIDKNLAILSDLISSLIIRADCDKELKDSFLLQFESILSISKKIRTPDILCEDFNFIISQLNVLIDQIKPLVGTNNLNIDEEAFLIVFRNLHHLYFLIDYWNVCKNIEDVVGVVYY